MPYLDVFLFHPQNGLNSLSLNCCTGGCLASALFRLAQFCKKPCNPVFNVLQFFKKKVKNILCMFFVANFLRELQRERIASWGWD